jgi:guanidinoacetate N-methyltransferase
MERPRVLRRDKFTVTLQITDPDFIKPSNAGQTNWVLTRQLEELAADLEHLDDVSKRFVDGSTRAEIAEDWARSQAQYRDSQLVISGQQVMQEWERPYMEAMARAVAASHGDVLEVGFGMGISASYIQAFRVKSHTIIECNEDVARRFDDWKTAYPDRDIRLVRGRWQDVLDGLGRFDGIFFDTYPLSEEEFERYVTRDVTFAEHFFEPASRHLHEGGVLVYYSNEIDSVSRRHQRALFRHFKEVGFSVCRPLFPPDDCNYWWADAMVVARAVK